MRRIFSFPHPVNEVSARLVATGVVALVAATLAFDQPWLMVPLAYGFVARVLTGPTLSPLGQLATRVVTPLLPVAPRPVSGPPKRFAQGIGVAFSLTAVVLHFAFGLTAAADGVLAALGVAASLEAFAGVCLGCRIFALLIRAGLVPDTVCAECADIWSRPAYAGRA